MKTFNRSPGRSLLILASAVAFAMAGCSGGNDGDYSSQQPSPPRTQGESFTAWSKSAVFNKPAESSPEIMDSLVFNFDGNDDVNAYVELLPPSM